MDSCPALSLKILVRFTLAQQAIKSQKELPAVRFSSMPAAMNLPEAPVPTI
jgi:hypothetical protein